MTNQNTTQVNTMASGVLAEQVTIEQMLSSADGSIAQAIGMLDAVNLTLEQRLAGVSVE